MLQSSSSKLVKKLLPISSLSLKNWFFAHQNVKKYRYAMNKAYFRKLPADEELQINFHYKNPELNIDRDFNFVRNFNENIELCLGRIKHNLEKELIKKPKNLKKLKKENPEALKDLPAQLPSISIKILKNNSEITNSTFADLLDKTKETNLNLILRILDDDFQILYNNPWVVNLNLPTSILAGYFLYPNKLEMHFANKLCSKGIWYKALMPKSNNPNLITNWEKIHEGLSYCTKNSDIDYLIKFELIPGSLDMFGPSVEVVSKNVVQAGPGKCPFEDRHVFTQEKLNGDKFRVITYNLLADLYADSDYSRKELFPYCAPYALNMDYRKQLLIKEILGYNGDIISLQEVDCKIFENDLKPILENHNYDGVMQKKGKSGEGIANFYRNDRFELIHKYGINIGENIKNLDLFKELSEKIQVNEQLLNRIVIRGTALLVTVLKSKDNGKFVIVANTHLYFHPDSDHIRLLQIGFSMLYVEDINRQIIEEFHLEKDQISIVFSGDFNSTPECGIYKLLTQKHVDENCIDWRSNEIEAVKNVTLTQPFNFKSAYGCPPYTHYTHVFQFCLDYIFYQTDNIELEQIVPLPPHHEVISHIAIPSVIFPSDHLALVADLKWKC